MTIESIKRKIAPILESSGVSFAGIFGSRARREERSNSDVDLLVKFKEPKGLFELIGLEQELSKELGLKVDLVTEGALKPLIKENILKDLKAVYGRK